MLLVHLYVALACVTLLTSSLPLGVGGRLWIMTVVRLGHPVLNPVNG